ncbi:flagellar biosynthesis protein FlhF, partial [Peribacillus sp. NPDC060186]
MKVKKYMAPSMAEVMKKIREELGSDAIILSSKAVYIGGFLGLFKKRNIEVIAAIDPVSQPSQMVTKQKTKKLPVKQELASKSPVTQNGNNESTNLSKEIEGLKDMIKSIQITSDRHYPRKLQKINDYLTEQEVDVQL